MCLSSQRASWQHLFYLPNVPNEFWFFDFLFWVLLCKEKKEENVVVFSFLFNDRLTVCCFAASASQKTAEALFLLYDPWVLSPPRFFFVCVVCILYAGVQIHVALPLSTNFWLLWCQTQMELYKIRQLNHRYQPTTPQLLYFLKKGVAKKIWNSIQIQKLKLLMTQWIYFFLLLSSRRREKSTQKWLRRSSLFYLTKMCEETFPKGDARRRGCECPVVFESIDTGTQRGPPKDSQHRLRSR